MPGRHGRTAALPSPGFERPASLDETGLIVTVHGENGGTEGVFDFTPMPGAVALRREAAAAFDRKSGPSGTWRARATCRTAHRNIKAFLGWLAAREQPPATAAEITPAVWAAWRLSLPASPEGILTLTQIRGLTREMTGLPEETRKLANRRIPLGPPPKEESYSYQELAELRSTAARTFNTALVRIRANREHLRRWYAGEFAEQTDDWLTGKALDCLVRTGDVPLSDRSNRRVRRSARRVLGGCRPEQTWGRLFLSQTEAFAAAVLLTASEGWNRSVMDQMQVPEHDPAAADDTDIYMVEIHKRRRPVRLRYTTNNLVDSGPDSPGRLLAQVIEATEVTRQYLELQGRPTRRLLVWRRAHPGSGGDGTATVDLFGEGLLKNMRHCGLDLAGRPAEVSLRRIRRTVQVLIRKEPAQNSTEVHESVYRLADPAARDEAQQTIAQGLADALEHAQIIVKMRMVMGDDAGHLIELSDDPELAKAIANGDYDTATGACSDFTNSPFSPPGSPCSVSFLLCLACRNAIATRRHLPRLVYLRHALQELRAAVEEAVWDQDWQEHYLRLVSLLDHHTTAAEQAAALTKATGTDRVMIDRLLRRKLDS
jgi:hypothetical protein